MKSGVWQLSDIERCGTALVLFQKMTKLGMVSLKDKQQKYEEGF